MSTGKKIRLLCSEADREALQPLLDALREKGLRITEASDAKKDDIVLAALTENFYSDRGKTEALLSLVGAGAENILPVQLDEKTIPDAVKNALYARNIIPAAGRETGLIAERIAAAIPQSKSALSRILIAAAVVVAAVVGIILWRGGKDQDPIPPAIVETESPYVLPAGLTTEDLEKIEDVIIVGERAEFYTKADMPSGSSYPDWDYFAYREFDNNGAHWYSRDDGHEYRMTRYEDLRFLELMPNLRYLTLAQMEAGQMPELSKLTKLRNLMLMDSVIPELDWAAGSSIRKIDLLDSTGSITDFSPLTSCEKLSEVHIDVMRVREADFTGFAPPALSWLWINNGEDLRSAPDLSVLSACTKLRECHLDRLAITDLDFLSGGVSLEKLRLSELHELRDISGLSGQTVLKDLQFEECRALTDFGPLASCTALQRLNISCGGDNRLRDVSFLSSLPHLSSIGLGNVDLPDLDFLNALSAYRSNLNYFGIWGRCADYSGLAAIQRYDNLSLDPDDGVRLDAILPYLEGAAIQDLQLRRFSEVDLSALPKVSNRLELDRCGIEDLSTMPEDWYALILSFNKCERLRSLAGLEKQSRIGQRGIGSIEIYACPRLSDWSALEGMDMSSLRITGGYTLPDFAGLTLGRLRLDRVAEITDLQFLDAMEVSHALDVELVGLDELKSLEPLRRFHGRSLVVPPQLAEQAEDLVKSGNYIEYRVEYPEGGWELDDMAVTLLSLDELDTLPPALLRRVEHVCLVGDTLVDINEGDIWEDWSNGRPTLMLNRWNGDEPTPIAYGHGFTDVMEMLSKLTGLKELRLYRQPIRSLDGIQNFPELEETQIVLCDDLTDASAAFACPNLRFVRIDNCPITSIQGVQNLRELMNLNINGTKVSDLSPLAECDFSAAREDGGFDLFINNLPVSDYAPIAGIPLNRLDINNVDAERYLELIEGAPLRSFQACDSFMGRSGADANALFADFVRSHPQLEYLNIAWNQAITDLSPLLELEELQEVRVSRDMEKAIASLDGQNLRFRLEIEG